MIPRIIIQRAGKTYEKALVKVQDFEMLNEDIIEAKIGELKELWEKWGNEIITELNQVTKLEWMDASIRCYVTHGIPVSFSHPLTLKVNEIDVMFDVLVHELIHRLLNNPDHPEKFKQAKHKFIKEYENESRTTKVHILLHTLHSHILMKFFDQNRLKRATEFVKNPDYVRSWEIVNNLGYENIIKQVFR